jgi:hypothetical protein
MPVPMLVRAIGVFPVLLLLNDFVCLLTYEFCLSLWKIARCSVILLLPLFATGRWFSQGNLVFSTNKTDRHDNTEILLEVALSNINQTKPTS